jgi:hypothetical protein
VHIASSSPSFFSSSKPSGNLFLCSSSPLFFLLCFFSLLLHFLLHLVLLVLLLSLLLIYFVVFQSLCHFPTLTFALLNSGGSFLIVFGYWQFLMFRYLMSTYSRTAFSDIGERVDNVLLRPGVPTLIQGGYTKFRAFLSRFAQSRM